MKRMRKKGPQFEINAIEEKSKLTLILTMKSEIASKWNLRKRGELARKEIVKDKNQNIQVTH